jgi:hypothetical protein
MMYDSNASFSLIDPVAEFKAVKGAFLGSPNAYLDSPSATSMIRGAATKSISLITSSSKRAG